MCLCVYTHTHICNNNLAMYMALLNVCLYFVSLVNITMACQTLTMKLNLVAHGFASHDYFLRAHKMNT